MGQFDRLTIVLEREEEYPSLNLTAPSMVTLESEASRSTIPVPLAAYDAPRIPPLSLRLSKLTHYPIKGAAGLARGPATFHVCHRFHLQTAEFLKAGISHQTMQRQR
ncbi:MAG: hypothetical protein V3R51_06295 [Gammaproteobacteria bacterium]